MNAMTCKGYCARVDYDAEDELFVGRLAGIADVAGFHADNVPDLKKAFHEAVDDYIEACAKIGKTPRKSCSGKKMFRVYPDAHRRAAIAAELFGKSLNQRTEALIADATA